MLNIVMTVFKKSNVVRYLTVPHIISFPFNKYLLNICYVLDPEFGAVDALVNKNMTQHLSPTYGNSLQYSCLKNPMDGGA